MAQGLGLGTLDSSFESRHWLSLGFRLTTGNIQTPNTLLTTHALLVAGRRVAVVIVSPPGP